MKGLFPPLAAALTLIAAPAFADDVAFAYSPSDLSTSASLAALYARIEKKAWRACGLYERSGLWGVEFQEACAADLVEDFVGEIDHPALTALHEDRLGDRYAEHG